MYLIAIPIVLVSYLILRFCYRFVVNYVTAIRSGLPFITIPIDQNAIIWMIFSVPCRPLMAKYLPHSMYNRIRYTIYGWETHEKLGSFHFATNKKPGKDFGYAKTFALLTCGRFEIWTASPTVIQQILLQNKDFLQHDLGELFVAQFGPNVLSSNGDTWTRHRKVVASAITERISPVAWAESLRQTKSMLQEICDRSNGEGGETKRFFDMVRTITIHVLSKVGLGIEKEWEPADAAVSKDNSAVNQVSYMDAVKLVNDNIDGPLILPTKALLNWPSFLPGSKNLRRLGLAKALFPLRTSDMLGDERRRLESGNNSKKETKNNLLSMLLACNTSEEFDPERNGQHSKSSLPAMNDEELVSNLYICTAAGYDTTASTISFAIVLLIRYPKWQKWLCEEIDYLHSGKPDTSPDVALSDYQATFPKCTRILAFMYETLRLFPVIIHVARSIKKPVHLTTEDGNQFVIPPFTTVMINMVSLHLDATVWRNLNMSGGETENWEDDMPGRFAATPADVKLGGGRLGEEWRFRPTRWINSTTAASPGISSESLFQPPRGTYLPWSMGPRVCPGQRMAQVEFTAIILAILSKYHFQAVMQKDESPEALNKRLDDIMRNSNSKLALEMDVYDKSDEESGHASGKNAGPDTALKVRLVKRK